MSRLTRIVRFLRSIFPEAPCLPAEQRRVVRQTAIRSAATGDTLVRLFCDRLRELNPHLANKFAENLDRQARQLITTLEAIAAEPGQRNVSLAALRELERAHAGHGVTEADYDKLQMALTWALEEHLDDMFDHSTRQAWTACYAVLADEMKAAARWRLLIIPPP